MKRKRQEGLCFYIFEEKKNWLIFFSADDQEKWIQRLASTSEEIVEEVLSQIQPKSYSCTCTDFIETKYRRRCLVWSSILYYLSISESEKTIHLSTRDLDGIPTIVETDFKPEKTEYFESRLYQLRVNILFCAISYQFLVQKKALSELDVEFHSCWAWMGPKIEDGYNRLHKFDSPVKRPYKANYDNTFQINEAPNRYEPERIKVTISLVCSRKKLVYFSRYGFSLSHVLQNILHQIQEEPSFAEFSSLISGIFQGASFECECKPSGIPITAPNLESDQVALEMALQPVTQVKLHLGSDALVQLVLSFCPYFHKELLNHVLQHQSADICLLHRQPIMESTLLREDSWLQIWNKERPFLTDSQQRCRSDIEVESVSSLIASSETNECEKEEKTEESDLWTSCKPPHIPFPSIVPVIYATDGEKDYRIDPEECKLKAQFYSLCFDRLVQPMQCAHKIRFFDSSDGLEEVEAIERSGQVLFFYRLANRKYCCSRSEEEESSSDDSEEEDTDSGLTWDEEIKKTKFICDGIFFLPLTIAGVRQDVKINFQELPSYIPKQSIPSFLLLACRKGATCNNPKLIFEAMDVECHYCRAEKLLLWSKALFEMEIHQFCPYPTPVIVSFDGNRCIGHVLLWATVVDRLHERLVPVDELESEIDFVGLQGPGRKSICYRVLNWNALETSFRTFVQGLPTYSQRFHLSMDHFDAVMRLILPFVEPLQPELDKLQSEWGLMSCFVTERFVLNS